jgi:hypothetical protein
MSNRLDRDEHGHFVQGNTVRKLVPGLARVYELKTAFLNASSPEKVADVEAAMYDLALNDPDSRVRLAAQVEYLNRTVGKPSTQIDVLRQSYEEVHQHHTASAVIPQLTREETAVLAKIVERSPALQLPAHENA